MAYTPGLKIKRVETVSKLRRLPIKGEVHVQVGDEVSFDTVIGTVLRPGDVTMLPMFSMVGVEPEFLHHYMRKKQGEPVKKGELLALKKGLFGLFRKEVPSPIDGTVELIGKHTGRVTLRAAPITIQVKAYVPGRITEVLPQEGAIIETKASFIQGIFGIGGEIHGELVMAVDSTDEPLTKDKIRDDFKGKIVVGGSIATLEALNKAIEVGAKGVVTGGVSSDVITKLVGYQIGVAITGSENIGLTFISTEGFGQISMAARTFEILKNLTGHEAAMNGATQIRAGVLRPEIIISLTPEEAKTIEAKIKDRKETAALILEGIKPGMPVRVIREPDFGAIGKIVSLPIQLQKIETESPVRLVEVELENGKQIILPRADIEIIEE